RHPRFLRDSVPTPHAGVGTEERSRATQWLPSLTATWSIKNLKGDIGMTRSFRIIAKWGLTGMVALLAVGSSLRPASAEVTQFTVDSGTLSADRTEVT